MKTKVKNDTCSTFSVIIELSHRDSVVIHINIFKPKDCEDACIR